METWMYFVLLGSHVLVAWTFYQKGITDTVEQISCQQQEEEQRKLWEQMTDQLRGEDDEDEQEYDEEE